MEVKQFPRITIVTPSFNQGPFIRETMESVLSQHYPNLEYIVIDSCSTDSTRHVLGSYLDRATIIVEKDTGQVDALIKGFKMATGEIFTWLNSDDILEPGALSIVAHHFIAHPSASVLVGNLKFINSEGTEIGRPVRREMTLDDWRYRPMSIYQPCTFFRADCYKSVEGLDSSLEYSMDYDLFIRFAERGCEFTYIDEILASFRFHEFSKSVAVPWRQWQEEFTVFKSHGGKMISPFYYWKIRSIFSYFIKHKVMRASR